MFDRRDAVEKNKLLSLAFDEQEHSTLPEIGATDDPKSVPAHVFKQRFVPKGYDRFIELVITFWMVSSLANVHRHLH